MKVIAFNGSPRPDWNTATLLEKALEGAASQGAETKLIHLYDLNFKGCKSCFACKIKDSASYGRCAINDDLTPILKQIEEADVVIFGSPIYFGTVSGEMKSFLERMVFPYLVYSNPLQSIFPRKIHSGFIYTMNIAEEQLNASIVGQNISNNERLLSMTFGATESILSFDTYQFKDYSKVVMEYFDPAKKAKRHEKVFPNDCEKAFEMGVQLTQSETQR